MKDKPITEEEILNSRFCKVNENLTRVTVTTPAYEEAKDLDYRILCVMVGALGLRVRDLPGSVENANYWLSYDNKERLLDLFRDELV